jgi:carbamoyltransferase
MIVLGLHYGHDGSACIVKDGKLIVAISSERITKQKKFIGVTNQVIDYVLDVAGITAEQIDYIALSDWSQSSTYDTIELFDKENKIYSTSGAVFDNDCAQVMSKFRNLDIPTLIVPHHLSHCASAFYTSNFDKAMCLSLDSSFYKMKCNSAIAIGDGNKLTMVVCPNMIVGMGYSIFTEQLGLFPAHSKAGTVMGLASYGKPHPEVVANIEKYVNESYFIKDDMVLVETYWRELWQKLISNIPIDTFKTRAMLAASIQYILESSLAETVKRMKVMDGKDTPDNLCLSGGSLLNCVSNTRIKNDGVFKKVHHFPACGDDGIAVGAALYLTHHHLDIPRPTYTSDEICYLGKKYDTVEPDYATVANMLANGKIVAWFMGSSEFGPRALGNRSILADPRNYHNRELINFMIKDREWYRPFAPSVLEEEYKNWFDLKDSSPYMLYTANVLKPKEVPAITHIDGTARPQTVNEQHNKHYYRLIKEFYKQTTVPMLLNTSLNGKDAPILETEQDALEFFYTSQVDALVLNGKLLSK